MMKTAANSGCFSPPLFAIYYAFAFLFASATIKNVGHNPCFCTAISTKTHCI